MLPSPYPLIIRTESRRLLAHRLAKFSTSELIRQVTVGRDKATDTLSTFAAVSSKLSQISSK